MKITLIGTREMELEGYIPMDTNEDVCVILKMSLWKKEITPPHGEEGEEITLKLKTVDHTAVVTPLDKK